MKKLIALALTLTLFLTACGGKEPFDPSAAAQALNASDAFSETLEEMDKSMFTRYFALDEASITDGVAYASTGATAEEFAVLVFVDDHAAQKGEAAMKTHVADLLEANRDYRPNDVPKLEKAQVERRGNTLLLLVANDYDAAGKALG